jgi:hypothetical protein
MSGALPGGPNLFATDGQTPLRELPAFLREAPENAFSIDLPQVGYASELEGLPRWIVVMDLGA